MRSRSGRPASGSGCGARRRPASVPMSWALTVFLPVGEVGPPRAELAERRRAAARARGAARRPRGGSGCSAPAAGPARPSSSRTARAPRCSRPCRGCAISRAGRFRPWPNASSSSERDRAPRDRRDRQDGALLLQPRRRQEQIEDDAERRASRLLELHRDDGVEARGVAGGEVAGEKADRRRAGSR